MKSEGENAHSSRRDENSLHVLTRKFLLLLKDSPNSHINMAHAAELLNVSKRRVYDITNVLEGLGLMTKWSVNSVKWIGGNIDDVVKEEGDHDGETDPNLLFERNSIQAEIDKDIKRLNQEIADLANESDNIDNAFVTYEDLQSLKIFKNKLVFALKAPSDTSMEYPRYEKGAYRLKIMTERGQIAVYYINNEE